MTTLRKLRIRCQDSGSLEMGRCKKLANVILGSFEGGIIAFCTQDSESRLQKNNCWGKNFFVLLDERDKNRRDINVS